MKSKHMFVLGVLIMILLAGFGFFSRQNTLRKERPEHLSEDRLGSLSLPRVDALPGCEKWCGNDPDPSTPDGRARLRDEEMRLPDALNEFQGLISMRINVFTNDDECAAQVLIARMEKLLDGFGRKNSRRLMGVIDPYGNGANFETRIECVCEEKLCVRLIERYYFVYCHIADWFWTYCGLECSAAEMDRAIFDSLRKMRDYCEVNKWRMALDAADKCLEIHKRDRCDSVNSNYCRAHRWSEAAFKAIYDANIDKNPRWVKGTEKWHGVFLRSARYQLKREPKWSPDYKETAKSEL